jgi:hypothetical protein
MSENNQGTSASQEPKQEPKKKQKNYACVACKHCKVKNEELAEGICTFFPKWERMREIDEHYCSFFE